MNRDDSATERTDGPGAAAHPDSVGVGTSPPLLTPDAALFLDVDGTLFELVSHPREVTGESGLTRLLQRLQLALDGALALVTGRALEDIDRIFHGLPLPVAALHGAVRRDPSGRVHRRVPPGGLPQRLREGLSRWVARHPGAWLEDKGDALAIHYRGDPSLADPAREWIEDLLRDAGEGYLLQPGKMVLELRPAGSDKGSAIREFMHAPPFAGRNPVFVGDDRTDEAGFAAVRSLGGVAVKVGEGESLAPCRLPDARAVREWLERSLRGLGPGAGQGRA